MVYHLGKYLLITHTLHKIKIQMYKNPIEVTNILSNLHCFSEKDLLINQKQAILRKILTDLTSYQFKTFMCFPGGSDSKESTCNMEDLGSIPGLDRSHGRGHGNPLQYFYLKNPHGQRSLAGYSPWEHKKSDTIE